jgi:colanic acid/amylovoran biosynthesis glycosyltransferase
MELGCPPEKVRVQHLGVDTETIAFHPRQAPPDGTVRVLMAASFREKKGLSDGLRAFAEVFARYPRMELTIMGDANPNSVAEMNLKKELEAIARARALRGVVHFLGYQPHSVFLSQLQASHIFMQPSVTAADGDTEGGAPVSIIEAQASGAPVIATYHADIPEVVLDEESGFLVPEKDVSALAERLEYLASHPRAWSWLGRAGRTHVESQYDLRTQVCKLEEVYDGFIRQRPR